MDSTAPQLVKRTGSNARGWGDGCEAWDLASTVTLNVVAESMPAGATEITHLHERANQVFYVLSGELTIECSGSTVIAAAHEAIFVPAGAVHQARNDSTATVEFLAIGGPATFGDRVDQD